jgi:glutathione S-transferase
MYKLYNVKHWGSLAPHCLLEEMEVPYQNIWMTREQVRAPEFREINPLGQIPVLGLPDGRNVIESGAIITFLTLAHADKAMAPEPASLDYAVFLSTLHLMSCNLYPAVSMTYGGNSLAMNEAHDRFIVNKASERSLELFTLLDGMLAAEGPFLMGSSYTALDIYLFMLTLWALPGEGEVHRRCPHVAAVCREVRARPKLKAVLEAHGVLSPGDYTR